jgi:hypothetical protein
MEDVPKEGDRAGWALWELVLSVSALGCSVEPCWGRPWMAAMTAVATTAVAEISKTAWMAIDSL